MAKTNVLDLREKYSKEIKKQLQSQFEIKNIHQVPKLEKIVINRGIGESTSNSKAVQATVEEFEAIFGQKPIVTKAKKSIAGFKLREGMSIGCKVTLRGERMYSFYNKLVNIVLPKIRDFRGVSNKSFDKQGNYNLGVKEQGIFPEINFDKIDKARGFNFTFVTSTKNTEEARELLKLLGMPFRKK